jgi:acyl-CoA thioester hydrolase
MDAFGHVNNGVYVRWFESSRVDYFIRSSVMSQVQRTDIGPIMARLTVDYRLPLEYPDRIRAGSTAVKLGTTSFTLHHRVTSERHGGAIAAEGESVIVMVEYATGKKVPLWPELRASIERLEVGA